jgi:hypothetical protein
MLEEDLHCRFYYIFILIHTYITVIYIDIVCIKPVQVIFNGKIVTPQSLLSRKPPAKGAGGYQSEGPRRSPSWAPRDLQLEGSKPVSSMIEETEFPEKSAAGKAKRY